MCMHSIRDRIGSVRFNLNFENLEPLSSLYKYNLRAMFVSFCIYLKMTYFDDVIRRELKVQIRKMSYSVTFNFIIIVCLNWSVSESQIDVSGSQ